jgi:hypothetical protein
MLTDADTPPGLELIKTQTIGSSVSNVTISNAFSNTYENYKITISGVTLSTVSANNIYLRMYDGTSINGANYNWGLARIDIAATTVAGASAALGTLGIVVGVGTGDKFGTAFDIIMPNVATHTLVPFISGVQISTGYMYTGAGMHQSSNAFSGFDISCSAGTMTGGTIRVYGYRNSI